VKAWRAFDRFECRASTRTWIYRIATNVCLDMLDSRRRHPPPIDIRSGSPAESSGAAVSLGTGGLESAGCNGAWDTLDPAELAIRRDSIRLAFVVAFRRLPPRQRAVLILRDVLCWTSVDVAERLGTTVAAINSALQRARATLATRDSTALPRTRSTGVEHDELLLAGYVDAFDRLTVDALVSLLHDCFEHARFATHGKTFAAISDIARGRGRPTGRAASAGGAVGATDVGHRFALDEAGHPVHQRLAVDRFGVERSIAEHGVPVAGRHVFGQGHAGRRGEVARRSGGGRDRLCRCSSSASKSSRR
jgi:RNA polymerase sigma factor (sigma-70 family)